MRDSRSIQELVAGIHCITTFYIHAQCSALGVSGIYVSACLKCDAARHLLDGLVDSRYSLFGLLKSSGIKQL